MSFNFEPIEKGSWGASEGIPSGVVRLSRKRISVAGDVFKRLGATETPSGDFKCKVTIEVDPANQAIRLGRTEDSSTGFVLRGPAGGLSGGLTLPVAMARNPLVVGDYKETADHSNVFVLAR